MIETHPFGSFVPENAQYLLLGSFTGKESGNWFYGTKRNQFWTILEAVYQEKLQERNERENLFERLKLAVGDIIYQCERAKESNLDNNLINIVYNDKGIMDILKNNKIKRIYFSSRFVEKKFKKLFNELAEDLELITLPSPSPRYAAMSKQQKIDRYRELLPKI